MDSGELSFFGVKIQVIKYLLWILFALIPFYILLNLTPLLDIESAENKALVSLDYKNLQDYGVLGRDFEKGYFQYPVSQFVAISWDYRVIEGETNNKLQRGTPTFKILYDQLVLWLGFLLITFASIKVLLPTIGRFYFGPILFDMADHSTEKINEDQESNTSVKAIFQKDVMASERRAESMFARATLLLTGGIIMAFVGIVIFYITLPAQNVPESLTKYWPQLIRPTGVLVFIESVAWFLLRQYRSLIEDYKSFHRIHLKRANYLAAYILLESEEVTPEKMFLIASLINEDHSGKLQNGETTESLESNKQVITDPVSEVLETLKLIYSAKK